MLLSSQPVTVELPQVLQEGLLRAKRQQQPVLISISEQCGLVDSVDLFDRSGQTDRFFWSQPGQGFTLVGLGVAHEIVAVEESRFRQAGTSWRRVLDRAIVEGPRGLPGVGPLFYGGFRFDSQSDLDSELWQGYPDARLVLPELLYAVRDGEAWLTCNLFVDPDTDTDRVALAIAARRDEFLSPTFHTDRTRLNTGPIRLRELGSPDKWRAEVARTTGDIAAGKLEKAVLARAVRLEADAPFSASDVLSRLLLTYPDCTLFAIGQGERCFLGATPERLASVRDGQLRTMSVAGSIGRGATPDEDRALGASLLASAKDRGEHAVVVQALVEALGPLCGELQVGSAPTLFKLSNVQHLYTPVSGRLEADHTLLDVIERLHPTPAVGGRPRGVALQLIRERECFDRGWYAGPVGWLDPQGEGDFVVAIRSALLHGAQATLFAGCGIVADSDPEREYAESCLKLKPMLRALNAETR